MQKDRNRMNTKRLIALSAATFVAGFMGLQSSEADTANGARIGPPEGWTGAGRPGDNTGSHNGKSEANDQPTLKFTDILVPGGINPGAFGLNNKGTIVGNYADANDPTIAAGFIDQSGDFTDVG
jgi:hypothetical protein